MVAQLRILYWNPGGVRAHVHQLRTLLQEQDIQVVLLGETKLTPGVDDFRLPNYFVYRRDELSPAGAPYRGTAVAVRRDVVHIELPLPLYTHTRSIGVEVGIAGETLRLFAAYRPPGYLFDPQDIRNIQEGNQPTLIAGDLNAKHTAWGSRLINSAGRKLFNDAEAQGYEVIGPDSPTHVPTQESSLPDVLDVALCKNITHPVNLDVLYDLDTPHLPLLITVAIGAESAQLPKNRRRTDWEVFQTGLQDLKLEAPLNSPEGIEQAAVTVTNAIQNALQRATVTSPVRYWREELPSRLQRMKKRKRDLRELWARTRCPKVKKDLNKIAEELSEEMGRHRGATWEAKIDQVGENETSLHSLNRQLTRTKIPTCPLVDGTGKRYYSAQKRAEILAESLQEQFTPHKANTVAANHHKIVEDRVREFISGPTPSLEDIEFISPSEARKAASQLPKRKAPGPDNIPNVALAMLPRRALVTVTRVYNGILRTGHFPSTWKMGKVIALPKPGKDRRNPTNYRPITLLPTLAKLFERLMLKRLKPSLQLREEQFGFRAGHSTTLQLTRVVQHLSDEANYGRHTVGVFLDIEKAFDRVWHPGLVYKLLETPAPAMLVRIVASFLEGRKFVVSVEGKLSEPKNILAGVPQGSCLSPTLYSVFTNDIPTLDGHLIEGERDVTLALFADDSAYFSSSLRADIAARRMQRMLDLLPSWLDKWRMTVNVDKTVAILFSQKRAMPRPLQLNNKPIEWKKSAKYLGCHLDRGLRMHKQVDHCIKQARSARAMLRPVMASRLPINTKLRIYKTFIRSRITYAAPAWYVSAARSQRKRLQAQQNIALRVIARAARYVRNDVLARDLGMQSLEKFITKTARRMYDRADNGPYDHLRGFAPLHARPPDGRPLPRELLRLASSSEGEDS